jgi:hypothetical protein
MISADALERTVAAGTLAFAYEPPHSGRIAQASIGRKTVMLHWLGFMRPRRPKTDDERPRFV